ncbi:MAG TPA: hypothetical protein DCQ42_14750 [Halomonas sp.]|nr:hypothetical protein [Halomonas sp.]|tara:strand:+ start:585 stop:881 length:297 start_codon:yes stop_codon:yes gene_type:complete
MVKYTHLPISCLVVMLALFSGGDALLAWAVMATLWASREWTQAEYRWIESLGNGTRASMPWWGGFDPRVWSFKSLVMDMVAPAVVSAAVAWWLAKHLS